MSDITAQIPLDNICLVTVLPVKSGQEMEAVCISRRKKEKVGWTARQSPPHVPFDLICESKSVFLM